MFLPSASLRKVRDIVFHLTFCWFDVVRFNINPYKYQTNTLSHTNANTRFNSCIRLCVKMWSMFPEFRYSFHCCPHITDRGRDRTSARKVTSAPSLMIQPWLLKHCQRARWSQLRAVTMGGGSVRKVRIALGHTMWAMRNSPPDCRHTKYNKFYK